MPGNTGTTLLEDNRQAMWFSARVDKLFIKEAYSKQLVLIQAIEREG
jgi:hypothetical protein